MDGTGSTPVKSATCERSILEGDDGFGILEDFLTGLELGAFLGKGGRILGSCGYRKASDLLSSCSEVAILLERGFRRCGSSEAFVVGVYVTVDSVSWYWIGDESHVISSSESVVKVSKFVSAGEVSPVEESTSEVTLGSSS